MTNKIDPKVVEFFGANRIIIGAWINELYDELQLSILDGSKMYLRLHMGDYNDGDEGINYEMRLYDEAHHVVSSSSPIYVNFYAPQHALIFILSLMINQTLSNNVCSNLDIYSNVWHIDVDGETWNRVMHEFVSFLYKSYNWDVLDSEWRNDDNDDSEDDDGDDDKKSKSDKDDSDADEDKDDSDKEDEDDKSDSKDDKDDDDDDDDFDISESVRCPFILSRYEHGAFDCEYYNEHEPWDYDDCYGHCPYGLGW